MKNLNQNKKTSVEWLMPKILELSLQLSLRRISQRNCELQILNLFEQAKQMEKEQIIKASYYGADSENSSYEQAEQYYNETFKSE
jgi:hypothetical protein